MKAKDFYEKRKGNYYMNRGNKFLIVLTVTLAINDRLLILFSEKIFKMTSSCDQDVCFLVSFTVVWKTILLWLSPKVTFFASSNIPEVQRTTCASSCSSMAAIVLF